LRAPETEIRSALIGELVERDQSSRRYRVNTAASRRSLVA
jgi:hypothetical protein